MYMNVSEMGEGIFGIQAVSKSYYGKDALLLSRNEAAQIAAALPNPIRYTIRPLSRYVAIRSANLLRQMNNIEKDPDIQAIIK